MIRSSKSWWGRFLFQDKGILPSKRLLMIFVLLSIVLWLFSFWGIAWNFVIGINVLVLLLSLIDLFFSPKRKQIQFERTMTEELERGLSYEMTIEINNTSPFAFTYSFVDGLPLSFGRPFPVRGNIGKGEKSQISYETTGTVRGKYEIKHLYFRYRSLLGLWEKQMLVDLEQTIKVIPDLTETRSFLEDAQKFLLYEGEKIRKYQSGMGDFAQIRSYVVGDDPRKVNWRQTAKLQELMTNEYEPEHGKYMTILIDCGRIMGAELETGNKLEKTLEASITVAAAALKKGDYVSVLAFSKEVKKYIPPAKGMEHLQTILHSLYDLHVDAVESNYGSVFSFLDTMQKKRSLLLLFSDIRTFLHEEHTLIYLKRLRRRHLFLMIGIEDIHLIEKAKITPNYVKIAMEKSIAQQEILFKQKAKRKWESQGLQMTEARGEYLATAAVSHYIDIMNRHLL
ncbi:DUF58 domain-containing protein [Lederbergia sp. NSJ-179]|uniref:DUF58 domain-containing protein n=1 Tax=Lederbergia sp. NSJ-179 TaxID=2931402 RepID=UPI001FD142D4|nr:DUF58 domain-containing protein [Lederbergia sp. NSJ-179]MCJ7842006.1 DUF58 domain-containing protein [Lederbergia sp. NSJ-179]